MTKTKLYKFEKKYVKNFHGKVEILGKIRLRYWKGWAVVVYAFNPSTWGKQLYL